MSLIFLLVVLWSGLLWSAAKASAFSGPVASLLGGDTDTIQVLRTNRPERICLNGIDWLEKGQGYGQNAKHAAADLVFAFWKQVTLRLSLLAQPLFVYWGASFAGFLYP